MRSYGRHCCGDLGRVQDRCLLLGDQQGPVGRGVQDCCGKPRSLLLLAPRWIPSPCHVRSSRFLFSLFSLSPIQCHQEQICTRMRQSPRSLASGFNFLPFSLLFAVCGVCAYLSGHVCVWGVCMHMCTHCVCTYVCANIK